MVFSRSIFEKRTTMSFKTNRVEEQAESFLKANITIPDLKFKLHGGSDSTKSDIEVLYKEKEIFWVSVKSLLSQGGQITVEEDKGRYVCTSNDFVKDEPITKKIIAILNANSKYDSPSTRGDFFDDDSLILDWFKAIAVKKKEKFVIFPIKIAGITSFAIVPIADINLYFDIKGAWRVKQSGSNHTNESNHEKYKELAIKHLKKLGISVECSDLDKSNYKFYFDLDKPLPSSKLAPERYFSDKGYLGVDVYDSKPNRCYLKTCNITPEPNPNIIVVMYAKNIVLSKIDVLKLLNDFKKFIDSQIAI